MRPGVDGEGGGDEAGVPNTGAGREGKGGPVTHQNGEGGEGGVGRVGCDEGQSVATVIPPPPSPSQPRNPNPNPVLSPFSPPSLSAAVHSIPRFPRCLAPQSLASLGPSLSDTNLSTHSRRQRAWPAACGGPGSGGRVSRASGGCPTSDASDPGRTSETATRDSARGQPATGAAIGSAVRASE